MEGDHFGDDFDDSEEAMSIVVELADLSEADIAQKLPELIRRARSWRLRHVSTVD
jgi:hypothetical protein